jgi:hypothetical protein
MTAPKRPTDETPDEETLAFEEAVLAEVAGSVSKALLELIRTILVTFAGSRAGAGGELSEEQSRILGEALASRIRAFHWDPMRTQLARAAVEAHALGVERAARRFPAPADRRKAARTKTPKKREVSDVDASLRAVLREAETLARQGIRTETEVNVLASKVKAGKARIEGAARSVANEGINSGTLDVARTMKLNVMWIAERNACLHCLAHAGWVVKPGDPFPGVSFDPEAKNIPAVATCPLHPNCRCQLRTTTSKAGKPDTNRSSLDPGARLAAEARRSVVYQWTEYASSPAMARAAEALLNAGAGLPDSVERRARRMLKRK